MPKFRINAAVTGGKFLGEVEAETAEDAEKMGWEMDADVNLCHYCSDKVEDLQIERIDVYPVEDDESSSYRGSM